MKKIQGAVIVTGQWLFTEFFSFLTVEFCENLGYFLLLLFKILCELYNKCTSPGEKNVVQGVIEQYRLQQCQFSISLFEDLLYYISMQVCAILSITTLRDAVNDKSGRIQSFAILWFISVLVGGTTTTAAYTWWRKYNGLMG